MQLEELRNYCLSLPHVTEDIKWGNDLCFSIGGKMFCVCSLSNPFKASFKVNAEEFEVLTATNDIVPAPYLARHKWVYVQNPVRLSKNEWERYLAQSYTLVREKLPKKTLKTIS